MAIKTFTTGEVLTASDTNTYLANAGLVYIKSDTITSGTSKEITGAFSSAYDNYRIVVSNLLASGASGLLMRMGTNNSTIYYFGGLSIVYASNTLANQSGAGASSWNTGIVIPSSNRGAGVIELYAPQLSVVTNYSANSPDPRTDGSGGRSYSGYINSTAQFTSFTFLTESTQTFTSCDITIYGYRKA